MAALEQASMALKRSSLLFGSILGLQCHWLCLVRSACRLFLVCCMSSSSIRGFIRQSCSRAHQVAEQHARLFGTLCRAFFDACAQLLELATVFVTPQLFVSRTLKVSTSGSCEKQRNSASSTYSVFCVWKKYPFRQFCPLDINILEQPWPPQLRQTQLTAKCSLWICRVPK